MYSSLFEQMYCDTLKF